MAAGVSAVVALVGFLVNRSTALTMHGQKLDADRELAERKISADIALAERKFAYDKEVVAWRRRYELAEQILSAAYEVRDALVWARARVILKGEGKTREAGKNESAKLKEDRDSAFVPIERLTKHAKAFAALQTAQDVASAHFGSTVVAAIGTLMAEHRRIASASASLVEHAEWNEDRAGNESLTPFRNELWGQGADGAQQRINAAIDQLEENCKPALLAAGPT